MKYIVNINQVWSEDVIVSAKTPKQARRKAWKSWKANKRNYTLEIETNPIFN